MYSVFHVLYGKKSSQTIQDIHLYKIHGFFRTFPTIKREEFQLIIEYFNENEWIQLKGEKGEYVVTSKSQRALEEFYISKPRLAHINGFKYHNQVALFWKRFSLLFQVLSNYAHQNAKYYGVQRDLSIQSWTKRFLLRHPNREFLTQQLHDELYEVLRIVPDLQARIFLLKLSGGLRIGYSNKQIADMYILHESDVYCLFLDTIHLCIQAMEVRPNSILASIGENLSVEGASLITNSSMITFKYVKNGFSTEEIADKRRLKQSTIEDHIVELVINGTIADVSRYVSDEWVTRINEIAKENNTRQLKLIKQSLSDRVSYFQIRLALAKGGALY
ncbi:helix-turn-helix domain-containing protein [Bacillus massiliigorillae]|uniref:helix-turn-helix domain-containing protein n=1 Tax=Bacillus massiliigorillae TaxID=1243664 RepID=UPI0018A846DE|nr:helix-turn-helix domain-containing protein [Bacillus massiliigorillae]